MNGSADYFAATGTDLGAAVTRAVTRHRIGLHTAFDRQLDADRLVRAVRLTLDAEPVLGCRFVPEARRREWQRLDDLDGSLPFSVVETGDPRREAVEFQSGAVPDEGPQVAVALLRTPDHDEIGMKISHVVADAQAMKQYAYLLARVYSRLGQDPGYVPETNRAPRACETDVWNALSAEQRKAAKRAKSYAMPNWPSQGGSSGEGMTYRSASVSPDRFRRMKGYGRDRGATVNPVLLAAYFRSLVERLDPPAGPVLTLMNTADHRRYLADPDSLPISNISISGSVGIARTHAEDFDGTLRRFGESTAAWAATCYGAGPGAAADKLGRLGYRMMRRLMAPMLRLGPKDKTMPFLTNVGVIDDARLALDGVPPAEAVMFGPSAAGAGFVAMVSTYRERLTATMGFCEADLDAEVIEEVLSGFVSQLPG